MSSSSFYVLLRLLFCFIFLDGVSPCDLLAPCQYLMLIYSLPRACIYPALPKNLNTALSWMIYATAMAFMIGGVWLLLYREETEEPRNKLMYPRRARLSSKRGELHPTYLRFQATCPSFLSLFHISGKHHSTNTPESLMNNRSAVIFSRTMELCLSQLCLAN